MRSNGCGLHSPRPTDRIHLRILVRSRPDELYNEGERRVVSTS